MTETTIDEMSVTIRLSPKAAQFAAEACERVARDTLFGGSDGDFLRAIAAKMRAAVRDPVPSTVHWPLPSYIGKPFRGDISSMSENQATAIGDAEWFALVAAAKAFAAHLDQWEKIKFETSYGTVYVSIGRSDPYPDSFTEITDD